MRLTEKPTQPHLTMPRPAVAAGAFCEHPIDAARIETKHEGNDDSENGPGQPAGAFSMAEHGACCIAEEGHKAYIFVPLKTQLGVESWLTSSAPAQITPSSIRAS